MITIFAGILTCILIVVIIYLALHKIEIKVTVTQTFPEETYEKVPDVYDEDGEMKDSFSKDKNYQDLVASLNKALYSDEELGE